MATCHHCFDKFRVDRSSNQTSLMKKEIFKKHLNINCIWYCWSSISERERERRRGRSCFVAVCQLHSANKLSSGSATLGCLVPRLAITVKASLLSHQIQILTPEKPDRLLSHDYPWKTSDGSAWVTWLSLRLFWLVCMSHMTISEWIPVERPVEYNLDIWTIYPPFWAPWTALLRP